MKETKQMDVGKSEGMWMNEHGKEQEAHDEEAAPTFAVTDVFALD